MNSLSFGEFLLLTEECDRRLVLQSEGSVFDGVTLPSGHVVSKAPAGKVWRARHGDLRLEQDDPTPGPYCP